MKLFIAFSAAVLAAALRSPLIAGQGTQWEQLAIDKGARYWFFPMLAFLWTLLWAVTSQKQRTLRAASLVCLAVVPRAVIHDWQYRAYPDSSFAFYTHEFETAPRGAVVEIPVYPRGRVMVLRKH